MFRVFAALLAVVSLNGLAAWPEKPIKVLIGYAPGGSTDVVARLLAPKLGEKLGQPVIVENKPGGAGDLAAEVMLQAPPDGYTLLMTTVAVHAINPGLLKQRFHPLNDFTPIALVCSYPMIMIGSPQTSFKSIGELKELAAKSPTFYSSSGVGSPGHLSGELLVRALKADITHVPYKGAQAVIADLLGGHVEMYFNPMPSARGYVKQNPDKVTPLAVTSRVRSPQLPDVPTLDELGLKGFDVYSWYGLCAPGGTPKDIIDKLSAEVARALAKGDLPERLRGFGTNPQASTPEQFAEQIRTETATWAKIIKDKDIKAE